MNLGLFLLGLRGGDPNDPAARPPTTSIASPFAIFGAEDITMH
jgi:hypothetical protein